jgi:hypothetical protein
VDVTALFVFTLKTPHRWQGRAGGLVHPQALQNVPLRTLTATNDMEADLGNIVRSFLETNRQVGAIFPLLLVEVSRHPELRPALDVAWENVGYLISTLKHHQARGALQRENPLNTLGALVGPLFVTGMIQKVDPDPPTIDVEEYVRAFLHGRATGRR